MPGSVYKSRKFEAAISNLRQKKAALQSIGTACGSAASASGMRRKRSRSKEKSNQSTSAAAKVKLSVSQFGAASPSSSCASSCSCDDYSGDSERRTNMAHNSNNSQNTPTASIRPSVRVKDIERGSTLPLVKRVRREEERGGDRRRRDEQSSIRQHREERLRGEYERHHYEYPNDDRYQSRGSDREREERRAIRRRRQEKRARLLRKDYSSLLKYFLKDAIYFVMKSNNSENIQMSMAKGVWSTPPQNEAKLTEAYEEHRNVLLIFSAKESGRFAGFARLRSGLISDHPLVNWVLPPSLAGKKLFNGVFEVDWISRRELPFTQTSHLFNPLNEGKPVKIARDGQQIDSRVGSALVNLFPRDEEIGMIPLLKRMKKQAMDRMKKLDALHPHESRQVPQPNRLQPPADFVQRSARDRLQVVVENNLHTVCSRRRVHVSPSAPFSSSARRQHSVRPDVRDRLDFSRRLPPDDGEDARGATFRGSHQRPRHRYD